MDVVDILRFSIVVMDSLMAGMVTLQLNTSLFVARRSGKVILRDLAKDPVPHLSAARFGAFLAKPGQRTPEQQAVVDYSDALIGELKAADFQIHRQRVGGPPGRQEGVPGRRARGHLR